MGLQRVHKGVRAEFLVNGTVKLLFLSSLQPAGLRGSLERLQLDYVDIVFANRSDPNSPMEGKSCIP